MNDAPNAKEPNRNLTAPSHSLPDTSRVCPNCSAQLVEQQCKLKCLQCGYYLSCSDFY